MPTRLIVVRHGQTEWNAQQRYQGMADIPLDDVGQQQAQAAAAALADFKVDVLYTSNLKRAHQTASHIADALGVKPMVDNELREIDVGAWQGLLRDEVAEQFTDEFAAWNNGEDVRRGGGEKASEGGQRVAAVLQRLVQQHDGQTVMVVGHGDALKAAITHLVETGRVAFDGPVPHLDNCKWMELVITT